MSVILPAVDTGDACGTFEPFTCTDSITGPVTFYRFRLCAGAGSGPDGSAHVLLEGETLPALPAGPTPFLYWHYGIGIGVTGHITTQPLNNGTPSAIGGGGYIPDAGLPLVQQSAGAAGDELGWEGICGFGACSIDVPGGGFDLGGIECWWGPALSASALPWDSDPVAIVTDEIDWSDRIVSWRISRGSGPEVTAGAQSGQATLTFKNGDDELNPENGSSIYLDKLRDGTPVWVGVNSDGVLVGGDERGLFGGRFTDITPLPSPGADEPPLVEILAEDAISWMGRVPVRIDYAQYRSQAELRAAVLNAAGETRVDLAHEITTMPLSAADGDALSILEELNQANGTRHFARPTDDPENWYDYVSRNRQWRLDATVDASLSQLDDHVTSMSGWRLTADTVINQQKGTTTPITFSPSTVTVWQSESLPFTVAPRRPTEVWVQFDDYVANPTIELTSTGGTLTPSIVSFGDSAKITLVAPSTPATVTALSVHGSLARRWPPQSWIADDLTSQAPPRGIREGSEISGEYVGILSSARGIAEHVVWRYGGPQYRPQLIVTNWIPEQFELDLFDIIAYTSPQIGVAARLFEIVGLTHEATIAANSAVSHTTTYVLQECRVQTDPGWFVLDSSLLDGTNILAY